MSTYRYEPAPYYTNAPSGGMYHAGGGYTVTVDHSRQSQQQMQQWQQPRQQVQQWQQPQQQPRQSSGVDCMQCATVGTMAGAGLGAAFGVPGAIIGPLGGVAAWTACKLFS
jgi:hypothetical protein